VGHATAQLPEPGVLPAPLFDLEVGLDRGFKPYGIGLLRRTAKTRRDNKAKKLLVAVFAFRAACRLRGSAARDFKFGRDVSPVGRRVNPRSIR